MIPSTMLLFAAAAAKTSSDHFRKAHRNLEANERYVYVEYRGRGFWDGLPARCAYCGRYGPLGSCEGCGAPNAPARGLA